MSVSSYPPVPASLELSPKIKGVVIGAIKKVLERFQKDGRVPDNVTYGEVLADADLLYGFVRAYKEDRSVAKDVALDADGKPVMDDETVLICGMSLGQIERLLVFTTAKKVFAEAGRREVPPALRDRIAFAWQLPLLKTYATAFEPQQFTVLEDDVFALWTEDRLQAISPVNATQLDRLRKVAGEEFRSVLENQPGAAIGLSAVSDQELETIRNLVGDRLWDFLDRDPNLVREVLGLSTEKLKALGPCSADVCLATLKTLDKMAIAVLPPFMKAFNEKLGRHGREMLGDEAFDREFLREIVDRFESLGKKDQTEEMREHVALAVNLKWTALEPKLMSWLESRG